MFYHENLFRNEFFPSELPPCFNTIGLSDEYQHVLNALGTTQQKSSIPLIYSGYKSENSRRKFAVPNPYHYCKTVDLIVDKSLDIFNILNKSSYSLTAPIQSKSKPQKDRPYSKRSNSIAESQQMIESLFQDNRYEIRLDINSFFNNIYTHSIPWAIHTKAVAKKDQSPNLWGNQLDSCIRGMNHKQTNGILVGNAVSRIISEIILCRIDERIKSNFPDVSCYRFVDDYYIYTKSHETVQSIISFIRKELSEYELSFNDNKLSIAESPFLYGKPWVEEIKQYIHLSPDVFLSKSIIEYNSHKDIAILKYGLKVVAIYDYTNDDWKTMQSKIINLWVRFPSLSNIVMDIFLQNRDKVQKARLKTAIYTIIDDAILLNKEQELIWAVWFCKVFNISLSHKYISEIIEANSDLATIILLDIIQSDNKYNNPFIKKLLDVLYDDLNSNDLDDDGNPGKLMWTEHWLLAYEVNAYKWLDNAKRTVSFATNNPFFNELLVKNIHFYDSKYTYSQSEKSVNGLEYVTRKELYDLIYKLKKSIKDLSDGILLEWTEEDEALYSHIEQEYLSNDYFN